MAVAGGEYTRRWTSPAMYGDVHPRIWATFGSCQSLLVTLTDFALYFLCVVLSSQFRIQ
jgi:hypothetical protein